MSRVLLVLGKDLRVLRRSPLLLSLLVAYPLLVAALVGLVAGYGSSKPRVALVDEDHLPAVVRVGGENFRINVAIREVGKNVHLLRMSSGEAAGGDEIPVPVVDRVAPVDQLNVAAGPDCPGRVGSGGILDGHHESGWAHGRYLPHRY